MSVFASHPISLQSKLTVEMRLKIHFEFDKYKYDNLSAPIYEKNNSFLNMYLYSILGIEDWLT